MRTIILSILAIVSIGASGQGLIGLRGGPNFTNVSASSFIENNDQRTGFSGGLSYEYFLKDNHSISCDLLISQRGFTNDTFLMDNQGNNTVQVTSKFNYDYLSLPIKMGIYFGQKTSVFGNIGVVPSILVNAKTIIPAFKADGVDYPGEVIDVTDRPNRFDFGGVIEIGVNHKTTDKIWLFGLVTHQYSFTTITNSDYFANSIVRHKGMAVSFGIKYKLSKA